MGAIDILSRKPRRKRRVIAGIRTVPRLVDKAKARLDARRMARLLAPPSPEPLVKALADRGVRIRNSETATTDDKDIFVIAERIVERMGESDRLLHRIKKSVRRHAGAVPSIEGPAGPDWEMLRMCERAGLLPRVGYDAKTRYIWFRPPETRRARAFFFGGWLECYGYLAIRQAFPDAPVLLRVDISFGTGTDERFAELDVCALLPGDRLLWLEAKSGRRYGGHLPRAYRIAKAICRKEGDRAVVLTCTAPSDLPVRRLRGYHDSMRMVDVRHFRRWLQKVGGKPAAWPASGLARWATCTVFGRMARKPLTN